MRHPVVVTKLLSVWVSLHLGYEVISVVRWNLTSPGSPDPSLLDRDAVHTHCIDPSFLHHHNQSFPAHHSVIVQHVVRSHPALCQCSKPLYMSTALLNTRLSPSSQPGLLPLTQRRVARCLHSSCPDSFRFLYIELPIDWVSLYS
jgi:hypothetical protein